VVCVLYDASAEALGLLEKEVGTANRRTATKAITVMGGLGALATGRLLSDAADAAAAASRKCANLDPMTALAGLVGLLVLTQDPQLVSGRVRPGRPGPP
jgi:hypothetical protein